MRLSSELDALIRDSPAVVRSGFPWWLRPFLMRNVVAITLGRRIYLSLRATEAEVEVLLRHELVHVRQINRIGLVRFHARYVFEFARNLRSGMSFDDAYRHISFEQEAFAAETYNRHPGTAE